MKKRDKKGLLMIIVALLVIALFIGLDKEVYAKKNAFKSFTWQEVENGKIVKAGAYSFKRVGSYTYFKKTKSADAFKLAPFSIIDCSTNGKIVYYVDNMVLKKYVLSSGKLSSLKKIPKSSKEAPHEPDKSYVSYLRGNNIYITRSSWGEWTNRTFIYNIKTKKLTKSFAGTIILAKGKYVVLDMLFKSGVTPGSMLLCKISGSTLKKVKKLTSAGLGVDLVGNKLYYLEYTDKKKGDGYTYYGMSAGTLYRCNLNGSKKKKLGSFKVSGNIGQLFVSDITSKNCIVTLNGDRYRYNYKTKKMTKLAK